MSSQGSLRGEDNQGYCELCLLVLRFLYDSKVYITAARSAARDFLGFCVLNSQQRSAAVNRTVNNVQAKCSEQSTTF